MSKIKTGEELIQYLKIDQRLPGMNETIFTARYNKFVSNWQKQTYTNAVAWYCKQQRLKPMNRIFLTITYFETDRRRDPDNIAAAKKFILDGLVEAGVLKNDGWSEIAGWEETFEVNKDQPGIYIVLTEMEAKK